MPFDQICTVGVQCTNRLTPSFFTRKKLTKVVTRVANGASTFQNVDVWTLQHEFLKTGDGLAPAMNLKSVVHTGLVGGSIALPPKVFTHKAMDNRVDNSSDNYPPITRYRIDAITGEAGSHTQIEYSAQDCVRGSRMPSAPESNTLRCYPTWWTPEGAHEPILDWFHKYVVVAVTEDDRTGASSLVKTKYEYLGNPDWHFDEAEFAEPTRRTWSQWRGYGTVRTVKGDASETQSVTEEVYGRGMDGDKQPSGVREAWLHTSEGEPVRDVDRLRGFLRETRQYNAGVLVSASVNDPWMPDTPSATDTSGNKAFVNGVVSVRGRTLLSDGTWRRTRVDKAFNAEGIAVRTEDQGDLAVTGDESCTRSTYARNEAAWILSFAQQVETVSGTCAVTASATTIQSLTRSYYDNQELGAPPTRGLITKVEALDKWDAAGQAWVVASTATYDSYGRPLEVHDSSGQKTSTAYTPSDGPVREITSTNALGHVSKAVVEPAWGTSVATIDANNRRSDLQHDALGRLVAAWTPGHDKATRKADAVFEYQYNNDKPSVVVSKQLQDNYEYLAAYTLYDGMLRERQTQAPAPNGGRQMSDTFYDSRGLPYKKNGIYWNDSAPGGTLGGVYDNEVPGQTITQYDGMGRPTTATFRKLAIDQWSTTTVYGGDRVVTTPPNGGTTTTLINDAQGRTLEKRQHTAGADSSYDATKYAYTAAGQLSTVTDPVGNVWRYNYDLRGRVVATDDPDAGRSTMVYNAAGQVLSSTDSHGRTIANTYDVLGRPTARYEGSTTGTKLAEWEYDTIVGGVGLPAVSRRFVDGATYLRKPTGYDAAGRATGEKVIIPAAKEGVLGTTYEVAQTYTSTGKPDAFVRKAVNSGGREIVAAETVGSYYNTANGLLDHTSGAEAYVSSTSYSSFGEVLQETYGSAAVGVKNVQVTNTYALGSRRLERTIIGRETTTGNRVADYNYTYDATGNITKVANTPEGGTADTQCYGYDHLRRLTEAWTPSLGDCATARSSTSLGGPAPYWHSWTFDKTGNRLTETQHASAGDTVRTSTYPAAGAAQPHTARSVTTTGPTGTSVDTFAYDASGRTTSRRIGGDTQTLEYNAEGRLSRVVNADGKVSTYLYDADGSRLISREPSATTLYVFGQEIRLETGTSTPSWTRWYTHNGHVVAVRNSVTGLKWITPDHQGTNQVSVTPVSMEVSQRRQTPYGALRGAAPSSWPDRLGFVGGRNDDSGLVTVGARQYDPAAGRFLSADPIIDNNDPQQLNGYAYANNSPVTFSDPTGLLHDCGPDGVRCGGKETSIRGPNWDNEVETYTGRARAAQQQQAWMDTNRRKAMAEAGISEADYAKALADAHKTKWDVIKEVAWEVLKEISGWNDIVDCFTKGDIWACGGMIAGLVPWGKVGKIIEAGYNAVKAVSRLSSVIDKARGVLRRVDSINENLQKVANEKSKKVGDSGDSCPTNHSFVATTLVLMADGSTKPISEVDIGDKVKATDPTTGDTTDRDVVATIVHGDEGDMTRLTVAGEDGTTGTVDATSWHPVWVDAEGRFVNIGDLKPDQHLTSADGTSPKVTDVDRYTHFEPVYDLTIDGVHTYYVVTGSLGFLVHNCDRPGAVDTDELAESAGEYHELLHPVAQRFRTISVLDAEGVDGVTNIVTGGARSNLTRVQRAAVLDDGNLAVSMSGGAHAEVKGFGAAEYLGLTPRGIAASRPFCANCRAFLIERGATITSPNTAVWPS